jgi:hypothetical protein
MPRNPDPRLVALPRRTKPLSVAAKVGVVVGGYALAIVFSFCVVAVYISLTSTLDRDASGGMSAFGDALLFVAIFGVVSIVPTGLALVFLRRNRTFWVILCVVALLVASTSLVMVGLNILEPMAVLSPGLSTWAMLAFPRIFLSPFLAVALGLSALIAANKHFRWCLLGAAGIEGVSSMYGFFHWFAPMLLH